jgi:hypothetical protein
MMQETKTTQYKRPEKAFYSTKELVVFLRDYSGMVVTENTVHKWSMLGTIPTRRAPNGRLLFPVKEIQDWIDGGGKKEDGVA